MTTVLFSVHTDPPCPPSDRLMHVLSLGLEREAESQHRTRNRRILPHTMASPNSPNVALPDPPGALLARARRRAALTLLLQRS